MESGSTPDSQAPLQDLASAEATLPLRRQRWASAFNAPVSAMVVDIFRLLSGFLVVAYYVRLFLEYSDYTSESGFLDHALDRELFWFTKLSLFFPGSPDAYKMSLLAIGMFGSLMLTFGWRPKWGAAAAWIVAVSLQRWNFAVINVDDSSITLLLWWMLFLPIGNCLTYRTWRQGRFCWREEVGLRVDGFFVRAFFVNLFIYYLTAGLTKLWSPLWRQGLALFVILKLPLARTHDWWGLEDIPLMWVGNHFTLLVEPLLPFLVFLPKGHPLKWFGGLAWMALHLSIPLTIGVPYANFTLIAALVLVFHAEIDDWLRRKAAGEVTIRSLDWRPARGTKTLVKTYLVVLAMAMMKGIPVVGGVYEPAMATLYWGGVAQEYHLFDWIDRFNWYVRHQIEVKPDQGVAFEPSADDLFPSTVRGFIVQSYLLPMRWMRIPRPLTGEMRNSILERAAKRFVRQHRARLGQSGTVIVNSDVARVTRDNLDISKTWQLPLMTFRYTADDHVQFETPVMPVGRVQEQR